MENLESVLNERPIGSKIKVYGQFIYGYPAFSYGEKILTTIATETKYGVFYISDEGTVFTPADVVRSKDSDIEYL
ncbi:hypothetical protein [Paenibacillus amylolyticus]|uniref:hypothetical protein n=1 Tax=Paenibacillus amylolyticus TaxID=1451 RepID=UPI000B86790B|nr:hypothetical protein [Paenibacillus amylolyticus]